VATRELTLIKRRYCQDNGIKDEKSITLTHFRLDKKTMEHTFLVEFADGRDSKYYILKRIDLSGLSGFRTLDIPKQYRNDFDAQNNPAFIADWIQRRTGHDLVESDISCLAAETGKLTVVISPNSMRYKNSFQINRL